MVSLKYMMKAAKPKTGKYNYASNAVTRGSGYLGGVAGKFMDKRTTKRKWGDSHEKNET